MGPDGDPNFVAEAPDVAGNPSTQEFLVVWDGSFAPNETEIYGQRIAFGAEAGPSDFLISEMGLDFDSQFDANNPAVTYNPMTNEFLVVWQGDDNTPPLVDNEYEIFGQRYALAATPGCTFTLDTTTVSIPAAGLSVGAVDVTASGPTCGWEAVSNSAFITVLDINQALTAPGVALTAPGGSGRVLYSVAANTGAARTGTMTLAGQTVTVNQAGTTGGPPAPTPTPTPAPTPTGGPVFTSARFPSNAVWDITFQFSGGSAPFSLWYARSMAGPAVGGFGPGTPEPTVPVAQPWMTPVACRLQPGAVAHNNVPGQSWWVWVQDAQGRLSNRAEVQNMPSVAHGN